MRNLTILLGVTLLSILWVLIIVLQYSYSSLTLMVSGIGLLLLVASAAFLWFYRQRTKRTGSSAIVSSALAVGLGLGLLWVIEISMNNFLAPPLPARDIADDIFWALIALGILCNVIVSAYRTGRIRDGIQFGIWSGYVSGTLACGIALTIVVLGMSFLLQDPLNIAEWSARQADTPTTMASYFAYETFAGAFLHLTVLGIGMGTLLGILGGLGSKLAKTATRVTGLSRRPTP